MSNWQVKIENFLANHPDELDDSKDEESYLMSKLDLANRYLAFTRSIVYADLVLFIEDLKQTAYSSLLQDEKARLAINPENFKSDSHLKGVLAALSGLTHKIKERADEVDELKERLKEVQTENKT